MARLVCALLVVVLLGMFPSCDSISFGYESMGNVGRRGVLWSKINRPDTFLPNCKKGVDDYHEATDSKYDSAYDRKEAAVESYEATNKNNDG